MEQKTDVRDPDEKVVEIEMERLREFPNHPFKVIGDGQMIELQDSIKKYGVLNPLIVRPKIEGYYEIISGHRRKYAAEKLGYKKIPVIIRMMQNDESVVIMVDSNSQRDQITPSEKAYEIKSGKHTAIRGKEQKQFIRFHLLGEEFSRLLSKKKIAYSEYKKIKKEKRDYQIAKQNVEFFYAAQQNWNQEEDLKKKRQQQ